MQNLQRDLAMQVRVGDVDRAHAAIDVVAEQHVVAEPGRFYAAEQRLLRAGAGGGHADAVDGRSRSLELIGR
jgi:hypothetical protein